MNPLTTLTRLASTLVIAMALLACGKTKNKLRHASSSMEPTIKAGEMIEVDEGAFSSSGPSRWDVIVFEAPKGSSGHWTSRVVGLPGETVEIKGGSVVINGRAETTPGHIRISGYREPENLDPSGPGPVSFPYTVPPNHFFVLGDNVGNALDSRYWGGLEASKIVGKVPSK